ncbi:MAG: hypothetical protein R2883_00075 [Caldisericia bacterium]
MNVEIRAYANLAGFLDYTDILIGGTLISGSLPSAINAAGSPPGGFGFMSGTYDSGWAQAVSPLYFDNVNLSTYVTGATLDTVRLTDVWINGTKYPAGSKVVAGDFYRLENPVYGVTTGKNTNARYMDIEVLPGDIGLKYEIDGFSPEDEEFKPLKIEKTSHVKVYLDHELEGVYATGKVIGDKRNRLYYRPDSFYVNTIPAEYQVVYSSPGEAERNFFHPHTQSRVTKFMSHSERQTQIFLHTSEHIFPNILKKSSIQQQLLMQRTQSTNLSSLHTEEQLLMISDRNYQFSSELTWMMAELRHHQMTADSHIHSCLTRI